jgi:primase-polymerase (primpol)-like protein
MYDRDRYMTVTGHVLRDRPISDDQDALDALYWDLFPPEPEKGATGSTPLPVDLDDGELWDRMFASKSGSAIRALFEGDTSAYEGDDSCADMALCNHLAFWTGGDPTRIDRMFRQTGLMRDKWDRDDYREQTIARAVQSPRGVYTPSEGAERQI